MSMIYPSKIRIVPNCKLAKVTSNLSDDKYNKLLNNKARQLVEKKKHKKHGEIVSKYCITNVDGYDNIDPLSSGDYDVLSACISEIEAGNMCTTVSILYRALSGKVGEGGDAKPNVDQRAAILNSIDKLKSTNIVYDATDTNKKLGYNDGKEQIINDTILPCHYKTDKINGQIVDDTIYFDRQSPMFIIANQRNQIIRYDASLLDVPNQNNTPLVMSIKNCAICRIWEIINHKMTPTITLDYIFSRVRIIDKARVIKLRAREYLDTFLKHLQNKGIIDSFDWIKKGNKFYGVKIHYSKKADFLPDNNISTVPVAVSDYPDNSDVPANDKENVSPAPNVISPLQNRNDNFLKPNEKYIPPNENGVKCAKAIL